MNMDPCESVLRKLLHPRNDMGMGYVDLDRNELCLDVTIEVTDDEAAALRELMED